MRGKWLWVGAVCAALGVVLAACQSGSDTSADGPKLSFNATDITGAKFGIGFTLRDAATGEARTVADYKGKALVLFFGYMFCPDYCPTTMSTLAQALQKMKPEDAARVQVAMITVDPARDKPELLREYVTAFNPTFVGLYGSEDEIAVTAKEYKILYQKSQVKDDKTYMMDHSTQMYAIDPQGRLRLMIRHEAGTEAIAADLTTLLK